MSKFEVLILPIDKVENHPNADRLSLNHIRGYVAVSNKTDDGQHRYKKGQLVAYVPCGACVPEGLLRDKGYWDEEKGRGFLGGEKGDIVRPINLRRQLSEGLIFPCEVTESDYGAHTQPQYYLKNAHGHTRLVKAGDCVDDALGIHKFEALYTSQLEDYPYLQGRNDNTFDGYSIEDIKKYPNLLEGHQVVVTELLHGVHCTVGFNRARTDSPYFVADSTGAILDNSKSNIYTDTAKKIWPAINRYIEQMPAIEVFHLHGVIIGPGIQDITYGLEENEFRAIDIKMGLMGGGRDSIPYGYLGMRKYESMKWMDLLTVPVVWAGEFQPGAIEQLLQKKSAIGGGMQKGVVITSEDDNLIQGRRPMLKALSEKYLLRSKGTEYK